MLFKLIVFVICSAACLHLAGVVTPTPVARLLSLFRLGGHFGSGLAQY